MSGRDPRPRLLDILEAIAGVRQSVGGMSLDAGVDDEVVYTIVTRQLDEVEAATLRLLDHLDGEV